MNRNRNRILNPKFAPAMETAFDFSLGADARITYTGGNGTRINPNGVIETVATNNQRIDYDPVTLNLRGLIIEESRTNLLLNSLVDGTNLATQVVTTAATAYVLSFYGTGSIDLTGTYTAMVTGAGAYPTRTLLSFTPTAGALTLTVTGTVQFAQLEAGIFETSFIPTAGATVMRTIDSAGITGLDFSGFYNQTEGTFVVKGDVHTAPSNTSQPGIISAEDGTTSNVIQLRRSNNNGNPFVRVIGTTGGAAQISLNAGFTQFQPGAVVLGYILNNTSASLNGNTAVTDATCTIPTVDRLIIGSGSGIAILNGRIKSIEYYNTRLSNYQLQILTVI